ncbi:MAG: ABC transporter ATP-binding protein [Patescibacteria group bacterium]
MKNTIQVMNLKKYFGKNKAVDDVSFNVEKGEVFGFLGPNGAGKTTTIRCLMDFIRPNSGTITMMGQNAHQDSVKLKKKIGYLSGQVHLYDHWTGQQHIDLINKTNGKNDCALEIAKRFDFDPRIKTKKLSSGNRQKLGIIMAFMTNPEILICDEPTNALDPLLQNEVYELIKETQDRGTTIFMSSHNLREVEKSCTRVGIIKKGKMVATENILTLKDKKLYSAHVVFKDKIDLKEFSDHGIEVRTENNHGYIFSVRSDINPLMKLLEKHELKDLEINRASLEDIFLEFYEK